MGMCAFARRPLHPEGTQRHHRISSRRLVLLSRWDTPFRANRDTFSIGFNGMVTLDGFSTFANILLLVSGLLGIALAYGYTKRMGIERGEYYTLLLFSVTGMMLMAQANDLIIVFLALELLSIPLYVLAAFAANCNQKKRASNTSCSAHSPAGFVVYGTALIFGATGNHQS
jgi:NADH-quinone oxidoreductase subunit N